MAATDVVGGIMLGVSFATHPNGAIPLENGETPAGAGVSFRRAGEIRTPDLLTPSQAR